MFSLPIKTSETKVSKSVYKYSQNLCFCLFTIIQSFLIIYDLSQSNIFAQREIIIKFSQNSRGVLSYFLHLTNAFARNRSCT